MSARRFRLLSSILVLFGGLSSCSPEVLSSSTSAGDVSSTLQVQDSATSTSASEAESSEPTFEIEEFGFVELPDQALPFAVTGAVSTEDPDYLTDHDGIRLYEKDGVIHYHPVVLAQRGLLLEAGFRATGGVDQLELAMAHAEKLVEEADTVDDAMYFPYTFDFPLHGRDDAVLDAPWYSGMAQGQALSLFTRLYESTGEQWLMDATNATFASFRRFGNEGAVPWTVVVDPAGYLWLEEYPIPDADHHAFNGHNYAAYGLYDYYFLTNDGLEELQGALTTVLEYIDDVRNPGAPSFYELKYGTTSEKYHNIHINQLMKLSEMTGDPRFEEFANVFICDFPPTEEQALAAGC